MHVLAGFKYRRVQLKAYTASVEARPKELVSQSKADPRGKAALFQSVRALSQWARREMLARLYGELPQGAAMRCMRALHCRVPTWSW